MTVHRSAAESPFPSWWSNGERQDLPRGGSSGGGTRPGGEPLVELASAEHREIPAPAGDPRPYLDAGFARLKIGIEIDGREVHRAENVEQFSTDRRKWTVLGLHGWLMLHFSANHVFDEADWFLDCVREAVAIRGRQVA